MAVKNILEEEAKQMAKNRNKIAFWGIIILIVLMVAAIFIPMSIMRGTMADTVEQLNEKYNEDFLMAWSDIDDRPLSDTFNAIMKSNITGITYEATMTDGEGVIPDYESENKNAAVNTFVEQALPNTLALANLNGEALGLHIVSAQQFSEEALQQVATQLKAEFQLTTVSINTFQTTEENFTYAAEHYSSYYQRSALPAEAFDGLQPTVQNFTF